MNKWNFACEFSMSLWGPGAPRRATGPRRCPCWRLGSREGRPYLMRPIPTCTLPEGLHLGTRRRSRTPSPSNCSALQEKSKNCFSCSGLLARPLRAQRTQITEAVQGCCIVARRIWCFLHGAPSKQALDRLVAERNPAQRTYHVAHEHLTMFVKASSRHSSVRGGRVPIICVVGPRRPHQGL